MIKKYDYVSLKIVFLFFFYKFYKNILLNFFLPNKFVFKLNKKKNFFFKKKESKNSLISKRLTLVLKKRKKFKFFRWKKVDKGNFFLKKFFFKVLIKNRKFLKKLFYFNNKERQSKLTKTIYNTTNKSLNNSTCFFEYSLHNLLLRSGLFSFNKDILYFIKSGLIYVNNFVINKHNLILSKGDVVQLSVNQYIYKYILFSKKILKKKISLFKFSNWKFFKRKFFKKKQKLKIKKRKTPKYIHMFYTFKLNTPRYIETDFFTLTAFILKKQNIDLQPSYYLGKSFSYKLFPLYNFKKIN